MVHQKIKVRFPAPHESYSLQSLTYATANQNHHDNLPYAGQACGGKSQKKRPAGSGTGSLLCDPVVLPIATGSIKIRLSALAGSDRMLSAC